VKDGSKSRADLRRDLRAVGRKLLRLAGKDYVGTPLIAQLVSRSGPSALAGTFLANTIRNLWAHSVIFCGHFPDEVESFTEESIKGETRGDWYIRQMLGSANLEGGRLFHIMTGNLSHQIEHHLFPDMPSNRYGEIAPRVREICERYGLKYVSGPMHRQIAQTWRTIARLSLP
jgi:fatty acid desaturase